MKRSSNHALSLVILLALVSSCRETGHRQGMAEIAVTNSYLECVVKDLCPEGIEVLCLAPPGMCPSHFDIAPVQVRQLRNCRVLLLFDFQQSIEEKLSRLRDGGLKMQAVQVPAGLCVPDAYLATCREVGRILSVVYPERAAQFEERLAGVEHRLQTLATDLKAAVAGSGVAAAAVLTSHHQAKFAEWLGLRPIATFIGSDIETMAGVDHCLKKAVGQDIRFVIANRQEGEGLAAALAERLHAKAVVFSNFPQSCEGADGFDGLVRDNVGLLLGAAGK
ncbi:MAG: zinc ABC transporter substrate-binding protein [Phycisphaerae bacterium]|nr:zinc ABC transporter substrate-binding protein [Phycisphaerae bacterium]